MCYLFSCNLSQHAPPSFLTSASEGQMASSASQNLVNLIYSETYFEVSLNKK